MEDDDGSLNITPSFKSKSKGKGRQSLSSRAATPAQDDDDLDEGSSAILFKKGLKGGRKSGLGASSSSKKASGSALGTSTPSKRLGTDGEGDGDGDDSAVVMPSLTSRKFASRPLQPSSNANYDAATRLSSSLSQTSLAQPTSTTYSKEYLDELKASNVSAPAPSWTSANGSGYDSLTLSKFGSSAIEEGENTSTLLPTENAIAAAKAKRETARRLGVDASAFDSNSDFISLDVARPTSNRESRLVREEDELGEGEEAYDEYTGASQRIALGKKSRQLAEKSRKEGMRELIDEAMDEEMLEADEEAERWEMEQLKRGEQRHRPNNGDTHEVYRPAAIPEQGTIPNLISVSNRLKTSLAELQRLKAENDELLQQSERERQALDNQEAELRTEVDRVSTRYEWFLDFKAWIEDVASFLDAKFPKLEKIEADNLAIQRERMDMLIKRRIEDDSDDIALFTGAEVPLSRKAPGSEGEDADMDVDDMGRDRRNDLNPRSFARQTRRLERKKRHAASVQKKTADAPEDEGMSTDDELVSSDAQDLQAAGEALLAEKNELVSDVQAEEYLDPSVGIRPRFEDWKHKYGEDYANAFAGLAMVGVWEFWTRKELAAWNPFGVRELPPAAASMEDSQWHKALSDYQHTRAASVAPGDAQNGQPDPADDVVNGMVSTVIVPRLRRLAIDGYDPYSAKATNKALAIVEEITYCIEPKSQRFEYLLLGFLSRFQLAILRLQALVLPFIREIRTPVGGMDVESIEARQRVLRRMIKLLKNGLAWRRYARGLILPEGSEGEGVGAGLAWDACLARELVGKTMLPVLEAHAQTGGSDVAQDVIKLFPAGVIPDDILRRLQSCLS